jgi:hypothetical protein
MDSTKTKRTRIHAHVMVLGKEKALQRRKGDRLLYFVSLQATYWSYRKCIEHRDRVPKRKLQCRTLTLESETTGEMKAKAAVVVMALA